MLDARNAEEHDLVLELEGAEQKFLLYAQKAEEARISDELDRMHIANVVVAQAPTIDYEARRNPSLAMLPLMLIVSLLLSFGSAVAVDAMDPKVTYGRPAPVTSAVQVLRRDDDYIEPRVRVCAVEVMEVASPAEGALRTYDRKQHDPVIPEPAPPRTARGNPVTLEDLFGLAAPRRLRP